jgi:hypothetical protein
LLLSLGKVVVQQCACETETAEEAEFTAERCASLRKACVEPFLERAFFSGCYSLAVARLRIVLRGVLGEDVR